LWLFWFPGYENVVVYSNDLKEWQVQDLGTVNCVYEREDGSVQVAAGDIFTQQLEIFQYDPTTNEFSSLVNVSQTENSICYYGNYTFYNYLITSRVWQSTSNFEQFETPIMKGLENVPLNELGLQFEFINGQFILIDFDGFIATSETENVWTIVDEGLLATIYNIYYYENEYVVVTDNGIYSSSDGVKWNLLNNCTALNLNYDESSSLYFGNDLDLNYFYLGSSFRSLTKYVAPPSFEGIELGNDMVVFAGISNGVNTYEVYAAPTSDPSNWQFVLGSNTLLSAVFAQGMFWLLENDNLYTSVDGLKWTLSSFQPTLCQVDIDTGLFTANNYIYALCTDSNPIIFNGKWQFTSGILYTNLETLTYQVNAELYVSLGSEPGSTFTSQDGIHWEQDNSIYNSTTSTKKLGFLSIVKGDRWLAAGEYLTDQANIIYTGEPDNL